MVWNLVFSLKDQGYVLDVNGETVTARKVSYEFDFVSVVHRFIRQQCHCHIREL